MGRWGMTQSLIHAAELEQRKVYFKLKEKYMGDHVGKWDARPWGDDAKSNPCRWTWVTHSLTQAKKDINKYTYWDCKQRGVLEHLLEQQKMILILSYQWYLVKKCLFSWSHDALCASICSKLSTLAKSNLSALSMLFLLPHPPCLQTNLVGRSLHHDLDFVSVPMLID